MPNRIAMAIGLVTLTAFLIIFSGCEPDVTGEALENIPPSVRLPNSMSDSMYLPAAALIKWIGDDPDGVVVGYSYRVDGGPWIHEGDNDSDFNPATDDRENPAIGVFANGVADLNWDGGFGLLGVDDDGDNELSAYEDSSRYYGYTIYADEELPNGIDDDGDGRIDEDCWGWDSNLDGDCGYDPEPGVDEDPIDGIDNDGDGLVDEDPINKPRWVRALGEAGQWTFWAEATQDSVRFPARGGSEGESHLFEVKCIDNQNLESEPLPITVLTTTLLPTPEIVDGPANEEEVFVWTELTDTWNGVQYVLGGDDIHRDIYYNIIEDGRVVRWAWWIDDPDFVPQREDYTPEDTISIYNGISRNGRTYELDTGLHTLYVKCMDNAQAISQETVSRQFYAYNPTFDRQLLLIDATYQPFPGGWDEEQIYENTILDGINVERYTVDAGQANTTKLLPSDIGGFRSIYYYKGGNETDSLFARNEDLFAEYLSLGGDIVIEGLRMLPTAMSYRIPAEFEEGDFPYDWLGLATANEPGGYVFEGAEGADGTYPDVRLKAGAFPYPGLPFVTYVSAIPGADEIMTMVSSEDEYSGLPMAVRYRNESSGSTMLFFGFPIMYLEEEDLPALGQAIRADLMQ